MINKYPKEFEEIYQKVVIDQEELHKVIKNYPQITNGKNVSVLTLVNSLYEYLGKRNEIVKREKGKNIEFVIGEFIF